jgi:hypothetical protein
MAWIAAHRHTLRCLDHDTTTLCPHALSAMCPPLSIGSVEDPDVVGAVAVNRAVA